MTYLIVAGGTGGHLYPGIAVAHALKRLASVAVDVDVRFVVRKGDLGRDVLSREGFPVHEIEGQGLPREMNRLLFRFPFKLAAGWAQAGELLRALRPKAVLGMGGYVTFPVVASAHLRGIFTMVHEQNVLPGITNRFLGPWVDQIALSFDESLLYFSKRRSWVAGLPIREEMGHLDSTSARKALGLPDAVPVLFIFGGSLGAQRLNDVAVDAWTEMWQNGSRFQVLHVTGEKHFASVQESYSGSAFPVKVLPYCHQMAAAYAAASVVISRSGASTVAELIAANRRAVLIPYPHASGNHQLFNAQILEKRCQGVIIKESDLSSRSLAQAVSAALIGPPVISSKPLESPAAERIARALMAVG